MSLFPLSIKFLEFFLARSPATSCLSGASDDVFWLSC